ncbi:hypothetical protein CRENBAI_003998 [Crenichthys baileyi]|uniref:Uncharacterized protein n=1 Tax=Crenichthys baileyi TaxID=28760 RepID=A0AAV9SJ64_9TELE
MPCLSPLPVGFLFLPPDNDSVYYGRKRKADALDHWVERQKQEAMRNLPTDLEVLPSPLLLEQMEREAAQRQRVREGCSVSPPQLRCSPPASVPAAKPSSSSCRRNRRRAGVSQSAGEEVVSLPAEDCSKQARIFVCYSKVSQACCSSAPSVFSPVF